jgi:hypothetical protein
MPLNMPKLATDTDVMDVQPTGLPRPLVDESVVKQVTGLMSQDSPLMTQAKTAGLQQANQRGLLNSSMAIGSAQDSAYRAALPIASQEAAQRAQRNAQSIDIGSREGMQQKDIDAQRGMQERQFEFTGTQAGLDRSLQLAMQGNQITAAQEAQIRDITSREGLAAAERALQEMMQGRQFEFAGTQAGLDRALQSALQSNQITAQEQAQLRDIAMREGISAAERALSEMMQGRDIDATRENQIRDIESRFGLQANDAASLMQRLGMEIASREGMQAEEIAFRDKAMMEEIGARYGLQERDIQATMQRMQADIAARAATQEREIQYQTGERALDRNLQEQLASWNLSSSDRNAAAQMLSNMEGMYQEMYRSVMANPDLDAATRTQQLQSAMNLRNSQIDFVQQMYDIKLTWPR